VFKHSVKKAGYIYSLLYKCEVAKLGSAATGKFINWRGEGAERERERRERE
jgi:hypothetical protein